MATDPSSANAYQAALVTRDRALQARQDSIDVLQRLLAQMGDDPLVVKAKENLQKILENPEVITDEVFNNIMSKTTEVMDSNYDTQVNDVLNAARSKGITGPALQATLQKAKEGRAIAIAGAYRDAIIERANSGLKTNLDAINQTSTLLNNLFNQQRVVTEDLVNTMQTIVEEPFVNEGPASLPSAGVVGGQGGYTRIDNGIDALNARSPAFSADTVQGFNPSTGKVEWTTPQTKAQWDAQSAASDAQRSASARAADAEAERQYMAWKAANLAGGEKSSVSQTPAGLPAVNVTKDKNGNDVVMPISAFQPSAPSLTTPSVAGAAGVGADMIKSVLNSSDQSSANNIQSAVTGAISGLTGIGNQVAENFASALKQPTYVPTTIPGTNIETTAQDASRGAQLVQQYGANNVIGTTSGAGVRNTGAIVGGKQVSAAEAARNASSAAKASAYTPKSDADLLKEAQMRAGANSNIQSAVDWQLENLKKEQAAAAQKAAAYAGAAGAAGAAAAKATPANWWDTATKAASAGFTGVGAALAGLFK